MSYGLEMCFIKKTKLSKYDKSQACLIKRNLGLSKFARNTLLLNALRVNKIIKSLEKVKVVFDYLKNYYTNNKCPQNSFINQLRETTEIVGNLEALNFKDCLLRLNEHFDIKLNNINKEELVRKIINLKIFHTWSADRDPSIAHQDNLKAFVQTPTADTTPLLDQCLEVAPARQEHHQQPILQPMRAC
ncbi:hypothetical protein BpHYR1_004350 [Brachionus plicatilis]|uniref:RNA-directed DNA polymerase from mobile element jockey-like n=1 Tax=Brachionus plicatilis TaxID=10195 RepID=A0A3M7QI68_BRAPC|nr:hypothetical protein BpHYR1_004350 [Brachionus plicatilis]